MTTVTTTEVGAPPVIGARADTPRGEGVVVATSGGDAQIIQTEDYTYFRLDDSSWEEVLQP